MFFSFWLFVLPFVSVFDAPLMRVLYLLCVFVLCSCCVLIVFDWFEFEMCYQCVDSFVVGVVFLFVVFECLLWLFVCLMWCRLIMCLNVCFDYVNVVLIWCLICFVFFFLICVLFGCVITCLFFLCCCALVFQFFFEFRCV